jgi:hypothetical protein
MKRRSNPQTPSEGLLLYPFLSHCCSGSADRRIADHQVVEKTGRKRGDEEPDMPEKEGTGLN